MRSTLALLLAVSLAGANTGCSTSFADVPPAPVKKAAKTVSVAITAATLADDCGPNVERAPMPEPRTPALKSEAPAAEGIAKDSAGPAGEMADSRSAAKSTSMAPPRCHQSSMQLSVIAPAGMKNTELRVKKVQIFDTDGTLIGDLTPKAPTVWTKDAYRPWSQKIKAGDSLAVSYSLSNPSWGGVLDPYSKSYTVKVVVSTGGSDLSLDHEVTMYTEASLPPGVVT